MPLLTLCMIVKNEEIYLAECLESVRGTVDEIVIVDTGSTDNTVEIAKKYKAKVYHFTWNDDFSAARNFALSKSTGNWILYLDADERITKASIPILNKIKKDKSLKGCHCTLRCVDEKSDNPAMMKYLRLFRNHPRLQFTGRVHEQIEFSLKKLNFKLVHCQVEIIHIGYNIEQSELKKKADRNLKLLLLDYSEVKTSYVAFQLAQTYNVLLDKTSAKNYFIDAITLPNLANSYMAHSFRYLAAYYLDSNNLKLAVDFINQAILIGDKHPLVHLVAAKVFFKAGDHQKAVAHCKRTYELNKELLSGEVVSDFEIMIEEKAIIYYFLDMAITYSNGPLFDFFLAQLRKSPTLSLAEIQTELNILQSLINGEQFDMPKIAICVELITTPKIPAYTNIISKHPDNELKLAILKLLYLKFPTNIEIINSLAISVEENGDYASSHDLLEKSYILEPHNPVTLFLMISNAVMQNNIVFCNELIAAGMTKFSDNENVISRLRIIIDKIASLSNG